MTAIPSLFNVPGLVLNNQISILSGTTVPAGTITLTDTTNLGSLFLESSTGSLYTLVSTSSSANTGSWQPLSNANDVTNTSQTLTISTIENLYSLLNQLQKQINGVSSQFVTTTVNQSVSGLSPVDGAASDIVKWIVVVTDPADSYINSAEVLAVYNSQLNEVSYSVYGQLQTGGTITGLDYNVTYTATGSVSGLVLEVGANTPVDISATRISVNSTVTATESLLASATLVNTVLQSNVSNTNQVITNVAYTYNSSNQITQITETVNGLPRTTDITYNGSGSISSETITYNGTTTTNTYTYNSNNLVTNISTTVS
jgi:hypothetical protein